MWLICYYTWPHTDHPWCNRDTEHIKGASETIHWLVTVQKLFCSSIENTLAPSIQQWLTDMSGTPHLEKIRFALRNKLDYFGKTWVPGLVTIRQLWRNQTRIAESCSCYFIPHNPQPNPNGDIIQVIHHFGQKGSPHLELSSGTTRAECPLVHKKHYQKGGLHWKDIPAPTGMDTIDLNGPIALPLALSSGQTLLCCFIKIPLSMTQATAAFSV